MRILISATTACLLLAGTAQAKDMKACSADWKAQKTAKATGSQTHKQFMTTCLAAGTPTSLPAAPAAPMAAKSAASTTNLQPVGNAAATAAKAPDAGDTVRANATAKCKDGSFSMSKQHSGSCSRHGGVAQFLQ